jgi:hypothetical protein
MKFVKQHSERKGVRIMEPLARVINNDASLAVYIDDRGKVVAMEDVRGVQRDIRPAEIVTEPHRHGSSDVVIQVRSGLDMLFRCCLIRGGQCRSCMEVGPLEFLKEVRALAKQIKF